MKKQIILSMAISMALVSSAASALAAASTETSQATVSNGANFTLGSPLEISGKIESISEGEMTVSTQDGKSYKVPLWQFAKQSGFSDLGLAAGTEVSLKSTLPDLTNIKVGTLTAATPLKLDAGKIVDLKSLTKANGSTATLTAASSSEGLKNAIPTYTLAPSIVAKGTLEATLINLKDLKDIKVAVGNATIAPVSGSITTLTAVPGVKLDWSKIQPGTFKIDEASKGIIGTTAIPVGGAFTLSALTEGESIFIAGEISANGKKLKLSN